MEHQSRNQQWPIIKYKQIKRSGRQEFHDVRVLLEESSRKLTVVCGIEELEIIYCNMEVSKFPSLKMRGTHLYVSVNGQAQGFRLTFHDQNRDQFMSTMRKIAFISETPEKNRMNRSYTNTDKWYSNAGQKKVITSLSQPVSFPPKRPAARNLAHPYKSEVWGNSQVSTPVVSPVAFCSQPIYSRPLSSASSISSSISSALSSLNDDMAYSEFSQPSSISSFLSSHSSSQLKSPYASSQSSIQLSCSPTSIDNFPPCSPIVRTDNKCIQTEKLMIDQLTDDPRFMNQFMTKLIEMDKVCDLVTAMRAEIQNMSPDKLYEFRKKTNPLGTEKESDSSSRTFRQPTVTNQASDLESDAFARN